MLSQEYFQWDSFKPDTLGIEELLTYAKNEMHKAYEDITWCREQMKTKKSNAVWEEIMGCYERSVQRYNVNYSMISVLSGEEKIDEMYQMIGATSNAGTTKSVPRPLTVLKN